MAIAISLVALVLSVISIGWNVYAWRMNGARLKIDSAVQPVWTRGLNVEMLCIEAKNSGRSETEVHKVDFPRHIGFRKLAPRAAIFPKDALNRLPYPRKLEPGGLASFKVMPENLVRYCYEFGWEPSEMRIRVRTGHRDYVKRLPKDLVSQLEEELKARLAQSKPEQAPRG